MKYRKVIDCGFINIYNLLPSTVACCQMEKVDVTWGCCLALLEFPICWLFPLLLFITQLVMYRYPRGGLLTWNTQGYTVISICWILCFQVHGACCHRVPWRNPSIWFYFHRNVSVLQCYWGTPCFKMIHAVVLMCFFVLVWQVLHFHIFLGLQNLLCVWFHDARPGYPVHRDCVRHHCVYILSSQCRGLQMVSLFSHMDLWNFSHKVMALSSRHQSSFSFAVPSLPGSGRASSLLHLLLFMFTCTPFTTISSKLSKFYTLLIPWNILL